MTYLLIFVASLAGSIVGNLLIALYFKRSQTRIRQQLMNEANEILFGALTDPRNSPRHFDPKAKA